MMSDTLHGTAYDEREIMAMGYTLDEPREIITYGGHLALDVAFLIATLRPQPPPQSMAILPDSLVSVAQGAEELKRQGHVARQRKRRPGKYTFGGPNDE